MDTRSLRSWGDQFVVWYMIAWAIFLIVTLPSDQALDAKSRLLDAVVLLTMLIAMVRATRLRVTVDLEGLTIFNYFATERIAWSEIESTTATFSGLRVCLTNGKTVTARGITRPKVNWNTKADRLAGYINSEARKWRD